jgi:hypothetical protein
MPYYERSTSSVALYGRLVALYGRLKNGVGLSLRVVQSVQKVLRAYTAVQNDLASTPNPLATGNVYGSHFFFAAKTHRMMRILDGSVESIIPC